MDLANKAKKNGPRRGEEKGSLGFRILIALALAAFALAGCGGYSELVGKDYPESAELNYRAGLQSLVQEDYESAQQYFSLVKTKFSFSMYATSAELLIADTLLKRDLYIEAVDSYKAFQRNHPNHACVPYAQYRIGESYMEQMPEDWWFMPPSFERDSSLTTKALAEFQRLVDMEKAEEYFFEPDFKPETIKVCNGRNYHHLRSLVFLARQNKKTCLRQLVAREVYVARFYLKEDKPRGAVGRLESAFRRYPDAVEDLELVKLLATAYEEAHMYKKARAVWVWIAQHHAEETERSQSVVAALARDEAEWTTERDAEAKAKFAREEKERAWRAENGVQELDPDPDPNLDAVIPLP